MPTYLKYQDRGYMYTPHHNFIEFIKNVDEVVRETIKETGLEEYGDQIVKVCSKNINVILMLDCR